MLDALLQSQFDLYYKNLVRHISIQKLKANVESYQDLNYAYKYAYQQNLIAITMNNIPSSFTIIIPPNVNIINTITPNMLQQLVYNNNTLVINAIYFDEYANSITQSLTTSASINSNTLYIPVLSIYADIINIDCNFYSKAMQLKQYYNYTSLVLSTVINTINMPNINSYAYYDFALIPSFYSGAINFYYVSSFDLLYSTSLWSFSFNNNLPINNAKNYEKIFPLNSVQPYYSYTQNLYHVYIKCNFNIATNFTADNLLELKIQVNSPITITENNIYNLFMVAYKQVSPMLSNNMQHAIIDPNINKFQYIGIQPNYFVPMYIYKQNIVFA